MSYRRMMVNPATALHLICRGLAIPFELAVLILLIYITVTVGYTNGVRHAGVICAILHDVCEVVALTDCRERLPHVPPPCVVIFDIFILILLAASIAYDFLRALSHLDKRRGPFYHPLLDAHYYMIYTMLTIHGVLVVVTMCDFCLRSRFEAGPASADTVDTTMPSAVRVGEVTPGDLRGVELHTK